MTNQPSIRLRPVQIEKDVHTAVHWYQDQEVLYYSEGPDVEPYSIDTVRAMYEYLMSIGTLYIIETEEQGEWIAIGDVTLSQETIPIVIGDAKYRSKGIGRLVIKALIEKAKKAGWSELRVKQVFEYNERSHRMFTSLGFTVINEEVDEHGNKVRRYSLALKR